MLNRQIVCLIKMDKSISIKEISTETELKVTLELCYAYLGNENSELYCHEAWANRLLTEKQPLLYAVNSNNEVISAVLGRAENQDSMVLGFVVCHPDYRRRGITKALMERFETLSREMGYKYITAGSMEDGFYESCGYSTIFSIHGQNIYQKQL